MNFQNLKAGSVVSFNREIAVWYFDEMSWKYFVVKKNNPILIVSMTKFSCDNEGPFAIITQPERRGRQSLWRKNGEDDFFLNVLTSTGPCFLGSDAFSFFFILC